MLTALLRNVGSSNNRYEWLTSRWRISICHLVHCIALLIELNFPNASKCSRHEISNNTRKHESRMDEAVAACCGGNTSDNCVYRALCTYIARRVRDDAMTVPVTKCEFSPWVFEIWVVFLGESRYHANLSSDLVIDSLYFRLAFYSSGFIALFLSQF